MKKISKLLAMLVLAMSLMLAFAACDNGDEPPIEKFTVTFNTNGAGEVAAQKVNKDGKITEPTGMVKTGYTLGGWYISNTDFKQDNKWSFLGYTVVDNMTLYAKWNIVVYDIKYLLDGGTNHKSNPSSYTIESGKITLQDPTKSGYTFAGWAEGNSIASGGTGDKTFTAEWANQTALELFDYSINNQEISITGFDENGRAAFIPKIIDGYPVTSIAESAFADCYRLEVVTIPDSVTSIAESAFENCFALMSITIPNSVESIGESAFESCQRLKTIIIPDSVTSIGESAFYFCFDLTSVTIGSGVESIGKSAFQSCYGLISITIPDNVTSIGESAFSFCDELTSVTIGNGVTSIGESAFARCNKLASVTIGSGVESIGDWAFAYCSKLASVTIGSGVESIGDWAFDYCSKLTIYAEVSQKPESWSIYWNSDDRPVVWGSNLSDDGTYVVSVDITAGSIINADKEISAPYRKGYIFMGWTNDQGTTVYTADQIKDAPMGTTMQAIWLKND